MQRTENAFDRPESLLLSILELVKFKRSEILQLHVPLPPWYPVVLLQYQPWVLCSRNEPFAFRYVSKIPAMGNLSTEATAPAEF